MKRNKKDGDQQESNLAGKPVSASRSEMTEIVLPAQTNQLGKTSWRTGDASGGYGGGIGGASTFE